MMVQMQSTKPMPVQAVRAMAPMTDWAALWNQIVTVRESRRRDRGETEPDDVWSDRAAEFDARVRRRWDEASVVRDTLVAHVEPMSTVLDVGAGTGAWAVPLAAHVARVTALEPSPAMRRILERNVNRSGAANIEVVDGRWPDAAAAVAEHDVVLCSHAMYGAADLVGFVAALQAAARRHCILVVRAPSRDSLMCDAARIAWGHPHFVPDFTVAYNVLLGMGLYPDVVVDPRARSETDASPSLDAALEDVKRRLGVAPRDRRLDAELADLLRRRLITRDERLVWPGVLRSAVIHWSTVEPAAPPGRRPG